ncbi:hypothetical protein J1N35_044551 [Gossypium stocksii]|uniref:Uncharacterized protein n=1 Tax=Gossypium stocksii TaxID=47602 RepID=A0A9D3ZGC4_9ROSI|nr:hypothetical protein J1N35_044551 [Gossypium stocksii]
MTKGVDEQNVLMETRGWGRKNSRSRDVVLALKSQVINLDEPIGGVEEKLKVVDGCIDELNSTKEQLMDNVAEALSSNLDAMKGALNVAIDD